MAADEASEVPLHVLPCPGGVVVLTPGAATVLSPDAANESGRLLIEAAYRVRIGDVPHVDVDEP